jgi:hypothetical protein
MKELINLIEATDTANPAELPELYKEIISAWDALNK